MGMHLLSIHRRGSQTGTDSPNGLIGKYGRGHTLGSGIRKDLFNLTLDDYHASTLHILRVRLANTDDRHKTSFDGPTRLGRNQYIVFMMIPATLTMTNDHEMTSDVGNHR
jgi:hypothetical protein